MKLITEKDLELLQGLPEEIKNVLRQKRKPLLNAFDILKSNVNFGVDTLLETEKEEVLIWYSALLNLESWAFNVIPKKILRYL